MEVLILDCPEIQCPPVLRIVFWEFCGAFRRKGVSVRIINQMTEIHNDAIVLMGDWVRVDNPGGLLAKVSAKAIYVGWYWHKQDTSLLPNFLHIYENVIMSDTLLPDKIEVLRFMKTVPSCPLLLRADEDPEKIGTYPRQHLYDYCFMGGRMCEWLVPDHKFKGVYYGSHDISGYMSYDERRPIYLASVFALGFQTDDNIRNGHVSQRIFEAMSYGCVVLSHSLHASIQTDGIVEYVEPDRDKYAERMEFFLRHPEYMRNKQERGYEFVKKYGTNEYACFKILEILANF